MTKQQSEQVCVGIWCDRELVKEFRAKLRESTGRAPVSAVLRGFVALYCDPEEDSEEMEALLRRVLQAEHKHKYLSACKEL